MRTAFSWATKKAESSRERISVIKVNAPSSRSVIHNTVIDKSYQVIFLTNGHFPSPGRKQVGGKCMCFSHLRGCNMELIDLFKCHNCSLKAFKLTYILRIRAMKSIHRNKNLKMTETEWKHLNCRVLVWLFVVFTCHRGSVSITKYNWVNLKLFFSAHSWEDTKWLISFSAEKGKFIPLLKVTRLSECIELEHHKWIMQINCCLSLLKMEHGGSHRWAIWEFLNSYLTVHPGREVVIIPHQRVWRISMTIACTCQNCSNKVALAVTASDSQLRAEQEQSLYKFDRKTSMGMGYFKIPLQEFH